MTGDLMIAYLAAMVASAVTGYWHGWTSRGEYEEAKVVAAHKAALERPDLRGIVREFRKKRESQ